MRASATALGTWRRALAHAFSALHRWLVTSSPGLVGLALIIGAGAGAGAVVFRYFILGVTELVTGRADYSDAGRVASTHLPVLGPWFLLLAPVAGGLIYGPLVHLFAREARGHGVPEVMFAVARHAGRIPARVAAVKALASGLCIGTGGSVGREGPIVQIGSALGSSIGQWLRVPASRLVLMVSCGAAGGISATFNAPIAGVLFGLELILRAFNAQAFGILVISSVIANVIAQTAFGDESFLHLPHFTLGSPAALLPYALLGLLAGMLGWLFARVLYLVEDACDALWHGPEWLRPAVGGLLLGAVLLALPQLYGVGYPVIQHGVAGQYALGLLLLLTVGKMLATSLTIGIGGSGGVFAPSLFIGAMAGTAFGTGADILFPGLHLSPGAFGLIGMAAVFAGAAHAPITAVVIVFELTGDYPIILPLMIAVALGTGASHLISRDTIYTLKLVRRGVDINAESTIDQALRQVTVAEVMRPAAEPHPAHAQVPHEEQTNDTSHPAALHPDSTVHDVLDELAAHRGSVLPVRASPDGPLLGRLAEQDVFAYLRADGQH